MSNEHRAERASVAIRAYRAHTDDDITGEAEDLIDILTDLRHFADRKNLNLGNCDRIAHQHYLAELQDHLIQFQKGGA